MGKKIIFLFLFLSVIFSFLGLKCGSCSHCKITFRLANLPAGLQICKSRIDIWEGKKEDLDAVDRGEYRRLNQRTAINLSSQQNPESLAVFDNFPCDKAVKLFNMQIVICNDPRCPGRRAVYNLASRSITWREPFSGNVCDPVLSVYFDWDLAFQGCY
jgi:hypothetical protein